MDSKRINSFLPMPMPIDPSDLSALMRAIKDHPEVCHVFVTLADDMERLHDQYEMTKKELADEAD